MDFKGIIKCNHLVGNPSVKYLLDNCPRCLGKGEYGSMKTSSTGDIELVSKTSYLQQSIKKILITRRRYNGYGFDYSLLSGVIDPATVNVVKKEIIRCINFLKDSQAMDKRRGVRYLPSEEIKSIGKTLKVYQHPNEPRTIVVKLSVVTAANTSEEIIQILNN